jgi:hypothetical protein
MATQLPVRIEFELPEGWEPASPDEVGAPGAAFVALHPSSHDGFTANITIAGQFRPDDATLTEIADESIARLEESLGSVRLRDREEIGTEDAPGLTQAVEVSATVDGARHELVQVQLYLEMKDVRDPRKSAVLELVLTATPNQLDTVIGGFQEFVGTLRPTEAGGK